MPLFAAFAVTPADKGVYQWGVEVDGVISKETKKPPRAYLWIPEKCESLKAVVLANDNMLEEPLFADDGFRASVRHSSHSAPMIAKRPARRHTNSVE